MKTKLLLFTLAAFLLLSSSAFAEYDTLWTKYTHSIVHLEFSKDDSKILTVGGGAIFLHDTETGEQLHELPGGDALYSDDGSKIIFVKQVRDEKNAIISYDIGAYDSETYEVIKSFSFPQFVSSDYVVITSSPDESLVVARTRRGFYYIDFNTGEIIKKILYEQDYKGQYKWIIKDFEITKDNQYLVMITSNHKLRFQNTTTFEYDYSFDAAPELLSISDDGSLIAFTSEEDDIAVSIMNTETKEIVGSIPGNSGGVTSITFSNDMKYLLIGGLNSRYGLRIFNLIDFQLFDEIYPNTSFSTVDINKGNNKIIFSLAYKLILLDYKTSYISNTSYYEDIIFPNPTISMANLEFEIAMPAEILLTITDSNGKEVNKISLGYFDAGKNTIQYDCSKLPNGVYFLTLSGKDFKKTYQLVKEG